MHPKNPIQLGQHHVLQTKLSSTSKHIGPSLLTMSIQDLGEKKKKKTKNLVQNEDDCKIFEKTKMG